MKPKTCPSCKTENYLLFKKEGIDYLQCKTCGILIKIGVEDEKKD